MFGWLFVDFGWFWFAYCVLFSFGVWLTWLRLGLGLVFVLVYYDLRRFWVYLVILGVCF